MGIRFYPLSCFRDYQPNITFPCLSIIALTALVSLCIAKCIKIYLNRGEASSRSLAGRVQLVEKTSFGLLGRRAVCSRTRTEKSGRTDTNQSTSNSDGYNSDEGSIHFVNTSSVDAS